MKFCVVVEVLRIILVFLTVSMSQTCVLAMLFGKNKVDRLNQLRMLLSSVNYQEKLQNETFKLLRILDDSRTTQELRPGKNSYWEDLRRINQHDQLTRSLRDAVVKRTVSSDLTSTQSNYNLFYKDASDFFTNLLTKLKAGYPASLNNIKDVLNVIKPNDAEFANNEANTVIKRVMFTLRVTKQILDNIKSFVDSSQYDWLSTETIQLELWISVVTLDLNYLHLKYPNSVDPASAGIGAFNPGISGGVDLRVLLSIKNILKALKG